MCLLFFKNHLWLEMYLYTFSSIIIVTAFQCTFYSTDKGLNTSSVSRARPPSLRTTTLLRSASTRSSTRWTRTTTTASPSKSSARDPRRTHVLCRLSHLEAINPRSYSRRISHLLRELISLRRFCLCV